MINWYKYFTDEAEEGDTDINDLEDNVLNAITPVAITSCVRCAVHTLQLCIHDGLKVASITNSISRARQVGDNNVEKIIK